MPSSEAGGLRVARGVIQSIALLIGFTGTMLSLMALVGRFTPNGWARFGISLVVTIVVPAVITDRLLPDHDPAAGKGMPGEIFALVWLGFTVAFVVGLAKLSRPLLGAEGDRLAASGFGAPARVAFLFAGYRPMPVQVPEAATGSSAAPSASGAPSDVTVPTTSSSSGEKAPSAPLDAGAPKKPAEGEQSAAELFKKLSPAVVTVSIKAEGMEGGGTGFLIDKEGTIVTNHHVVAPADKLTIRFGNGASYEDVELLSDDSTDDLALLRVPIRRPTSGDAPKVEPIELGDSDAVQVGEHVIAIGNPLGLDHTLTDGLVSQRRMYEGKHWIQMSAPISPGNSGGPLFDMKGRAIGVTAATMGLGIAQNLNLAVPINMLKPMIKSEYPGRHKIGKGGKSSTW